MRNITAYKYSTRESAAWKRRENLIAIAIMAAYSALAYLAMFL